MREVVQDAAGEWIERTSTSNSRRRDDEEHSSNASGEQADGRWRGWAIGLVAVIAAQAVWAQNQVRSINSTQQAGVEIVRIELSEPLAAVPRGFTVQTPPRIAIDLPGRGQWHGAQPHRDQPRQSAVRRDRAVEERARLVLNLRQTLRLPRGLQGNALVLVLDAGGGAVAPVASSAEPVHFAQPMNNAPQSLTDVDFRRGPDGAGRVVVNLPSNQVGALTSSSKGQSLVVEFLRSRLPRKPCKGGCD